MRNCIGDSVGEMMRGLRNIMVELGDQLIAQLAVPCCEVLRSVSGVRQVLSTHRIAKRDKPTGSSPYAATTLVPLVGFIKAVATRVSHTTVTEWTRGAVRLVCIQFRELCEEAVQSAKKTAAGLGLIKTRRKKTGAVDGAEALSDTQKICCQLRLDMGEMELRCREELGFDPNSLPEFGELHAYLQTEGN